MSIVLLMGSVMMTIPNVVTIAAGLWAFVMLGLAPLLIKKNVRHSATQEFIPYNPHEEAPPSVVLEQINRHFDTLTQLDFQLVAYLYQNGQVPGILSYLTMFRHPQGHNAMVVTMGPPSSSGNASQVFSYVEFTSDFPGDIEVNTLNSPTPLGTFAKPPTKHALQLWSIADARELFEAHRLHCARIAGNRARPVIRGGDLVEELRTGMIKDLDYQVERGLMVLDRAAGQYVMTLRGAYIMTWKIVWPIIAIRKRGIARRAEELLRKLKNREV